MNKTACTNNLREFKVALRAFTQEVCQAFGEVEIPRQLWTRIVREDNGVYYPQEDRPDLPRLLHRRLVGLHSDPTPSLQRAIESVQSDPWLSSILLVDGGGKAIVDESGQRLWATNKLAGSFLGTYFDRANSFVFDANTFSAVFRVLIDELQSSTVKVSELSPLLNASLDCDRIVIAEGLSIRKLTIDELEQWLNRNLELPMAAMHPTMPVDGPSGLDCAIELAYEKGRFEGWGTLEEIRDIADDLVTALRLVTDKNIHIAFTRRIGSGMLEPGGGTSSSLRGHRPWPEAQISASMRPRISDLWQRVHALPKNSPLTLALRRWDMVADRENEDDALIDYWVALEAMFVPESTQEVSYRASLRIAAFIAESSDDRQLAYKLLRDSYNVRSKIVHGGTPRSGEKTALVAQTRSYLRDALVKSLSTDESFDPKTMELNLLSRTGTSA